jgi:hypothetical protein
MPLLVIPKPPFPNVPALPGVPNLARYQQQTAKVTGITANISSSLAIVSSLNKPVWGVFDSSHAQILNPDSVVEISYIADTKVMAFPVQEGTFANYNKVNLPNEVSVRMTVAGSVAIRTAFTNQVESIMRSLNLYSVITPERTYLNMNAYSYTWDRKTAKDSRFLDITIKFIEVRKVKANVTSSSSLRAITVGECQDAASCSSVNTGNASPSAIASAFAKSIP